MRRRDFGWYAAIVLSRSSLLAVLLGCVLTLMLAPMAPASRAVRRSSRKHCQYRPHQDACALCAWKSAHRRVPQPLPAATDGRQRLRNLSSSRCVLQASTSVSPICPAQDALSIHSRSVCCRGGWRGAIPAASDSIRVRLRPWTLCNDSGSRRPAALCCERTRSCFPLASSLHPCRYVQAACRKKIVPDSHSALGFTTPLSNVNTHSMSATGFSSDCN